MIVQGLIFGGGGGGGFPTPDATAVGWSDAMFFRGAANRIEQRNDANPQTFRVYGTWTNASNGDWLNFNKAAGGAAIISTAGNGTGTAHDLLLQAGSGATVNCNRFGSIYFGGQVFFGATSTSAAGATSPGFTVGSNKLTAVSFGGGQIPFAVQYLEIDDGVTAPGALAGKARIYVDTADGDLKVVFADGTVKTIVTDT